MLSAWLAATQSERKATTTTTSSTPNQPHPPSVPSPWATLAPSVPRFGRPWIALQTLASPFFSREQHKCEEKGRERGKIKEELGWQQGRRQGGWGLGGSLPADTSRFSQPASTPHPMVFMHFISRR